MILFECNNVVHLNFIIFSLNFYQDVNSHKYIKDILKSHIITRGYQLVEVNLQTGRIEC
jgi:hypothetical protein